MKKNFFYHFSTAILFAGLMSIALGITSVYAQPPPPFSPGNMPPPTGPEYPIPFGQPPTGQGSNFTFGPIASIQNNQSGQPAWVVVGNWRGNLLSFNQTTTGSSDDASKVVAALFNANLRMIMLNGSKAHTHVITNFELSNVSSDASGAATYTGNSTISMPDGPIVDVPTVIKISGEIISISPDPSKVNEHFGNTPIYGVIETGPRENMRGPPPPPGPPLP